MVRPVHGFYFILLILRSIVQNNAALYIVPKAKIDVYYPKGFEVSIPHVEGMTMFAFHGKINEEMKGLEMGTFSGDVLNPRNGRWIFREHDARLNLGDTFFYWTYVIFRGNGYREDDGIFIINNYANSTVKGSNYTSFCNATKTTVKGIPVRCSGQIIFEDDFNDNAVDMKKWSKDHRIPMAPDYEFNMYFKDVNSVLATSEGNLVIKPITTNQHYKKEVLHSVLNLGATCTGKLGTTECISRPLRKMINRPLISAQIKTKDKFAFKYGRVEIRAKMPGAMWVYPQLWLEPNKPKYGDFDYYSGQMRVGQTIADGDKQTLYGGLVLNSEEPWRYLEMCQHKDKNLNLAEDFHVYELNWQPDSITVSLDGQEYCRIEVKTDADAFKSRTVKDSMSKVTMLPNRDLLSGGNNWAPFDQEFFLTFGYGVGGHHDFTDDKEWKVRKPWDNFDPFGKEKFWRAYQKNEDWLSNGDLKIDYVRVYAA